MLFSGIAGTNSPKDTADKTQEHHPKRTRRFYISDPLTNYSVSDQPISRHASLSPTVLYSRENSGTASKFQ
jgi:hypothetical protein